MKDLIETLEEYANGFINVIAPPEEDVKELLEHIYNQDKEINRLNNIISELEKTLKQDIYKLDDKENPLFYEDSFIEYATERRLTYIYILDKIKELKGSDSDE